MNLSADGLAFAGPAGDVGARVGVPASQPASRVEGLRALVHGHFVMDEIQRVANRWNIDTGASFPDRDPLTLLQVNDRVLRLSTCSRSDE